MDNKNITGSIFKHFKASGLSKEESEFVMKHPDQIPASLKDHEDKIYLISLCSYLRLGISMFFGDERGEDKLSYEYETHMCIGRKNAFNIIKEYFEHDAASEIDIDNSFVLVEGLPLEKRISLYRFIMLCNNKYDDELNIDSYIENTKIPDDNDIHCQATGNGTAGTLLNE